MDDFEVDTVDNVDGVEEVALEEGESGPVVTVLLEPPHVPKSDWQPVPQ